MEYKPLPSSTIENPNAVEELFCKEMDKAKTETLNKEDFELFVGLCSAKPIPLESVDKKDKRVKTWLTDIFEGQSET